MAIVQRKALNGFHQRKEHRGRDAFVGPRVPLPTSADLPEASDELRAGLDSWHNLIASERAQGRLASEANSQAERAATTYRADVRAALAAGDDPAKVKDQTDKHKAAAQAHVAFFGDAENERTRLGLRLGPMLETEAATIYGPLEERITDSAQTVRGSLTAVRDAWARYSRDFEMRRWLSDIATNGGPVGAYHGSSPLPGEVTAALAVLEEHISALDRLKDDEEQVRSFRAAEEQNRTQLARSIGA